MDKEAELESYQTEKEGQWMTKKKEMYEQIDNCIIKMLGMTSKEPPNI